MLYHPVIPWTLVSNHPLHPISIISAYICMKYRLGIPPAYFRFLLRLNKLITNGHPIQINPFQHVQTHSYFLTTCLILRLSFCLKLLHICNSVNYGLPLPFASIYYLAHRELSFVQCLITIAAFSCNSM